MQRIVLVTGAKGGLGTPVTETFLKAGDTVAGLSKSIQRSDFAHANFHAFPADLSNTDATCTAVDGVVRQFGSIDVLAHIAGGFDGGQAAHETGDAVWLRMWMLNVFAAVNVFRAVLPHMHKTGGGRIVAIGSRAAVQPAPGIAAYSASKAALVSLVQTVALENKDRGIAANVILPGTMDTAGNRAGDPGADRSKWVDPAKVAALVLFLASEAAGEITGAAIPFYGTQL